MVSINLKFKMEDVRWMFTEPCQISSQVHAKFFWTSRVREQEARRPTCLEWVSRTLFMMFFMLFVSHLDGLVLQAVAWHAIIFSGEVNSGQSWEQRNQIVTESCPDSGKEQICMLGQQKQRKNEESCSHAISTYNGLYYLSGLKD